ncbi:MAG TPA: ribosome small subunit-dependent GTPase A [Anaeromyxobacter sp.]|nr:ribosome small subunit-dependent GTPase A [Anaeromyxobacter sp.]
MFDLLTLGWGPYFSSQLSEEELSSFVPGRAVADRGPRLLVRFADGDRLVVIPGRLRDAGQLPVVGDFVLARASASGDEPEVVRVLERRSALRRGAAGRAAAEQVLAANVDVAVIVQGLDAGAAPRRLERTLAAVHECGAAPAIVLTKADLCEDPERLRAEAVAAAPGVPVIVSSAQSGEGLEEVRGLLPRGATGVLLGPSGAGKSTLLNALLGREEQAVGEVREWDRRGRHTTTGRALVEVPGGGLLVDGPGLRELKLWSGEGIDAAFEDVAALAAGCRFRDCRHEDEPGCAVRAAVEQGALDPARLESLQKLEAEARSYEARKQLGPARAEKQRGKVIARLVKQHKKLRGR